MTHQIRYYLLSFFSAKPFVHAVRNYWGIENIVHWVLDVAFLEDGSVRHGHAEEYFAVFRHITLNLLRQEPSAHVGIKARRLKAAWDTDYLQRVLDGA